MDCPNCRASAPEGARFCVECGEPLARRCTACGAEAAPHFRFCGQCGQSLETPGREPAEPRPAPAETAGPATRPPEPERKIATALAAELVVTPPFDVRAEEEHLHQLLDRFLAAAGEEIDRWGGTVRQGREHGLIALFGAPVSHEDHARRATMAALALGPIVERLEAPGRTLGLQAALASGTVVVGGRGDAAVGSLLGTASQLCGAGSGRIVLSASTHRHLAAEARVEPLADSDIPADQRGAVALLGLDDPPASRRTLTGTPFVGRQRDLDTLSELLERAAEGRGQVVGIAGEAGVGKSRLLAELRSNAPAGTRWWSGRCLSYASGTPYSAWSDLLRHGCGLGRGRTADAAGASLARHLASWNQRDGDRLGPYLERLVGADDRPTAGPEGSQAMRSGTFEAVERLVHGLARERPLVLELEDLHWIDETSEALLAQLVESVSAAPLLLLLTYRPGFHARWMGRSYATQINLSPLAPSESRRLLTAVTAAGSLSSPLVDGLLARAEGNPLYLEELGRSATEGEATGEQVPQSLQEVIAARVDRLDGDAKRLLQTAAVLDGEFPASLLAQVGDAGRDVESLLDELVRRELLVEIPTLDGTVYRFRHVLTQEVVYNSLLAERRRELHRRAALALEALWEGRLEDVYDRLAFHWPRAGGYDAAVRYSNLLAEAAVRSYAHAEAVQVLTRALPWAGELPADERAPQILELVLATAESLLPLARLPATLDLLERHRHLLGEVEDPRLAARFQFWLAHTHSYLGEPEAAAVAARDGLEAAADAHDEAIEGKLRYVLGRDAFWSGDFVQGREHSLRAVVLLERSGEPWWQGQAYWVAGFHHFALGDPDAAFGALERARTVGITLGDPRLDTSWSLGYFRAALGQTRQAIELCSRAVEAARDPLNVAVARGFLGYAWLAAGELDAARDALERSVDELKDSGMGQILSWFYDFLAELHLAQGRPRESESFARRALDTAAPCRFALGTAWGRRTLGRLALAEGDLDRAETELYQAFEDFERRGVVLEAARTRLDLASLAARRGDHDGAAEIHRKALARLSTLGVGREAAQLTPGRPMGDCDLELAAGGSDREPPTASDGSSSEGSGGDGGAGR